MRWSPCFHGTGRLKTENVKTWSGPLIHGLEIVKTNRIVTFFTGKFQDMQDFSDKTWFCPLKNVFCPLKNVLKQILF